MLLGQVGLMSLKTISSGFVFSKGRSPNVVGFVNK